MRKMHRLPNGFGSIKKLSGVRRNPYGAYPPCTAYYENGAPKPAKAIGYYPTYNAAFKALTEWNIEVTALYFCRTPLLLILRKLTLS